jgi:hypothetical protein
LSTLSIAFQRIVSNLKIIKKVQVKKFFCNE